MSWMSWLVQLSNNLKKFPNPFCLSAPEFLGLLLYKAALSWGILIFLLPSRG